MCLADPPTRDLLDAAREEQTRGYRTSQGREDPRPLTVNQLADRLRTDVAFVSVAGLYAEHLGTPDADLAEIVAELTDEEHVPHLAAYRHRDSGLRKRAEWEKVWELQHTEDRTGAVFDIPVPPRYGPTDFAKPSYWKQRGKLDVPKERFISYPDASPAGDPSPLLGWAGWDLRDQAQALANIIVDRADADGWPAERLIPLLAGLRELLPWLRQWYNSHDAAWGGNAALEIERFLSERQNAHGLTDDALARWRLPAPKRGRPRKTST